MVFRFGNSVFEPTWNRRYIDYVQITVAEQLGVEMRGGYYDHSGVVRDMVQNHILSVLSSWRWSRRVRSRATAFATKR